jgi:hypothetical protein
MGSYAMQWCGSMEELETVDELKRYKTTLFITINNKQHHEKQLIVNPYHFYDFCFLSI